MRCSSCTCKRTDALQIKVFYGTEYARTGVDGKTWAPSRDKLEALNNKNGQMLKAFREKTPRVRQDTLNEWGWDPPDPNASPTADNDTAAQLVSLGSGPETCDEPDEHTVYNVDEEEENNVDNDTEENVDEEEDNNVDNHTEDNVDEEEDDNVDNHTEDNVDEEEDDNADAAGRFAGTRKCSRKQQQGFLPSHSQDPRAFKKPRQAKTT